MRRVPVFYAAGAFAAATVAMAARPSTARADSDERIACVLTGETLARQAALRARPDAPSFGTVDGGAQRLSVRVSLPTGAGGIAVVRIDGEGLQVDGFVGGGAWLYPRKPVRVSPTVVVGGGTTLSWVGGSAGHVDIESKPPEGYRPARPLRASIACDALSLAVEAMSDDRLRAATGLPDALRTSPLKTRVDIPVAVEPKGAVDGTLRLGAENAQDKFEIVAESAGFAEVVVPRTNAVVHGWIPARFLAAARRDEATIGEVYGVGGLGLRGGGPAGRTCKTELPVMVRLGDRVDSIGVLHAGTLFHTHAAVGEHTVITLPKVSWLSLEKHAQLAVPTAALEKCTE